MMNIQSVVAQTRIARRMGRISSNAQRRVLARLGCASAVAVGDSIKTKMLAAPSAQWVAFMNLLNEIKAEEAPALEAKRKLEERLEFGNPWPEPVEMYVAPRNAPALTGFEYTPEWWAIQDKIDWENGVEERRQERAARTPEQVEAEKQARAARKAARKAAAASQAQENTIALVSETQLAPA